MILMVRVEKGSYSETLNSIFPLEKKTARCLQGNARLETQTQKLSRKANRKLR